MSRNRQDLALPRWRRRSIASDALSSQRMAAGGTVVSQSRRRSDGRRVLPPRRPRAPPRDCGDPLARQSNTTSPSRTVIHPTAGVSATFSVDTDRASRRSRSRRHRRSGGLISVVASTTSSSARTDPRRAHLFGARSWRRSVPLRPWQHSQANEHLVARTSDRSERRDELAHTATARSKPASRNTSGLANALISASMPIWRKKTGMKDARPVPVPDGSGRRTDFD